MPQDLSIRTIAQLISPKLAYILDLLTVASMHTSTTARAHPPFLPLSIAKFLQQATVPRKCRIFKSISILTVLKLMENFVMLITYDEYPN